MFFGRQEGMSTIAVLVLVGAASGLILATTQTLDNSKKAFRIAEINSIVDLEANQLELLLVDPNACLNTFGPANLGAASVAGAAPGAPVAVTQVRDGEAAPGGIVVNTAIQNDSYFPRDPRALGAPARATDRLERSQVLLRSVFVGQGNNTGAPINFVDQTVTQDITLNDDQFLLVLNYQVDPVTNKALFNAGGNPINFYRILIFDAQFNGGGQVLNCSSNRAAFFDQRYVNMKRDDRMTNAVPLNIMGRVSVRQTLGGGPADWTGYVSATRVMALSDETQKENINEIFNTTEFLDVINGKMFDWINGPQKNAGVIAQEIEQVFPNLIVEVDGYKSVNYNSLLALTTASLKEEAHVTDELEKSINSLKLRIQKMKDKGRVD